MRFMMIVIPKGYEKGSPEAVPSPEAMAKMGEFNRSMHKAGILLALDGLKHPSTGVRISYKDGTPTVTDGPFVEAKEFVGGFWIIQVRSREEAIEWAKRAPMENGDTIEVRQIHEMREFPPEVLKAVGTLIDLPKPGAGVE